MVAAGALSFDGVIGACLTPFRPDGRVDVPALERQIDFLVPDVDAVSIAAVEAAEYRLLAPSDRHRLIRDAAAAVDGRRPIVVGGSAPTHEGVLVLAEVAAEVGAAAVQVLLPQRAWGGQPEGAELLSWFQSLAAASPLPIIAYHHPTVGADPAPAVLAELAELDGVAGFKDSSRDITRIGWLTDRIDRAGHARYFTTMQPLLTTLLLGGAGAMMPPPATRVAARVVAAVRADDLHEAAREQRAFAAFPGPWSRYGLTPLMKRAMGHCGIELGTAPTATPELPVALEAAIAGFVREHVRPEPPTAP